MNNVQAVDGSIPAPKPTCKIRHPSAKFSPGKIVATPSALRLLKSTGVDPLALIARHVVGDWGDVERGDAERNEQALGTGERIVSVYRLVEDSWLRTMPREERAQLPTVWIVSEAIDEKGIRKYSTVLLPGDY